MRTRPKRSRPRRWFAAVAVAVIAAFTGGAETDGPAVHAQKEVPDWYVKTLVYFATTDDEGRFSVPHGLEQQCAGDEIYGLTVAIHSQSDGRDHGGKAAKPALAHYTWNARDIDGSVRSNGAFANVPIRIVAFTTRRMC